MRKVIIGSHPSSMRRLRFILDTRTTSDARDVAALRAISRRVSSGKEGSRSLTLEGLGLDDDHL
jgi:hypothetical protein